MAGLDDLYYRRSQTDPTNLDPFNVRQRPKTAKPLKPRLDLSAAQTANEGQNEKYAGLGIGVTGLLIENVISHPFLVLRRQCQVNMISPRYTN